MKHPLLLSLLFFLAPLASAQNRVWTVAENLPADFDELQPAIDAAADGDVLLVNQGDYGRITIDGKSLVIVRDPAALFARVSLLNGFQPDQPCIVIRNLGPGQSVFMRGIEAAALSINFPLNVPQELHVPSAHFTDNLGPIHLEDYSLGPPLGVPDSAVQNAVGLRVERCASVTLVDGFVRGLSDSGSAAIEAVDSALFVFDSIVRGAQARLDLPGGDGIVLVDGSLYVSASSVSGGVGVDAIQPENRTPGGNALVLDGTAPSARWLDTVLQGGNGGMHPMGVGTPAAEGEEVLVIAPSATFEEVPGTGGRVTAPLTATSGVVVTLDFEGEGGDLVLLRAGPARLQLGFLPRSGMLSRTLPLPTLAPGEDGRGFLLQPELLRMPGGITAGGRNRSPLILGGAPTLLTVLR